MSAHPAVADDELRRQMALALKREFAEPLRCLHTHAHALNQRPPSPADILCMCVATQMSEYQDNQSMAIAAILGWMSSDKHEQTAFAAGLRSRVAALLEPRLHACPPAQWELWLSGQWAELLPQALLQRVLIDGECTRRVIGQFPSFALSAQWSARWQQAAVFICEHARADTTFRDLADVGELIRLRQAVGDILLSH